MSKDKFIDFFTIVTNPKKLNKTITAFVFIVTQYGDNINDILDYAEKDPDILECYSITGEYDYIIKICAKDIDSLEKKILDLKKKRCYKESCDDFTYGA